MVLSNSPIMFGPAGAFVLNTIDSNGTKWIVQKFTGWHGTSGTTLAPVQKARQSGETDGDSFSTGRTMTMSGMIVSVSPAQHSFDLDQLNASISRAPTLMQVSESGRIRWVMVRRFGGIQTEKVNAWTSNYIIQIFAKDWRKFGTPLTGSTMLPASSGGFSYPGFSFPYSIPAVSVSGQVALTNPGGEVGPVTMQVNGPAVGPYITHQGSGAQLTFSSSLVLNTGEWLAIDMEKHTVLANGQTSASRAAFITNRGWSGFDPGPNTWQFGAVTYNSASQLIVNATPSWE